MSMLPRQPDKLLKIIIRAAEGPALCFLLFLIASFLPDLTDWHGATRPFQALFFAMSIIFLFLWARFLVPHHKNSLGKSRLLANSSFLVAVASFLVFFSSDREQLWAFSLLLLFCISLFTSFFLLTSCWDVLKKKSKTNDTVGSPLQLDQKILESSGEAIVITDAHAQIIDINKAYTQITGYTPKEVIGKNPRICKSGHHDRSFYKVMWQSLNKTGKWAGEIWDRRKNGEIYPKWLTINAVYDKKGNIIKYLGVFNDITEKKRLKPS